MSIVEAVRAARTAAHASALPHLNDLFGKQPPPSPTTTPADDESFEELDFLTDDKPEAGGGRW
ncbi:MULTISPECIES: hypothetical protein [unclassified Amycolatopsis]|uniref:hypothetical protein n=1 Tax=unclassified Amycolatopsis TaxID=2618356 RepID=UPI002875B6C3|nr:MULTISPECIES: hypothetical protein [unclassified Amycolatopsis]MDS0135933.1 hypothetical protein [Amycolatopsis sp. 505]MDS0145478.1 hypothetical protein [Amycolatopsis sp. CM201R]